VRQPVNDIERVLDWLASCTKRLTSGDETRPYLTYAMNTPECTVTSDGNRAHFVFPALDAPGVVFEFAHSKTPWNDEWTYPNAGAILPPPRWGDWKITVNADQLDVALNECLYIVGKSEHKPVWFSLQEGKLYIQASYADQEHTSIIDVQSHEPVDDTEFCINGKFVRDAISVMGDRCTLRFGRDRLCLVVERDGFVALIMQLQKSDETARPTLPPRNILPMPADTPTRRD
jgi:hypothetical protein